MVVIVTEGKSDIEFFEDFKSCYKYDLSDKFVFNTFYKQKKHPFDFSHKNFDKLKEKLTNLFKELS